MMAFQKHISTANEFGKKASMLHSFGTKISHYRHGMESHQNNEGETQKQKQTIEKR